jgi:STE24 endopeptidase
LALLGWLSTQVWFTPGWALTWRTAADALALLLFLMVVPLFTFFFVSALGASAQA